MKKKCQTETCSVNTVKTTFRVVANGGRYIGKETPRRRDDSLDEGVRLARSIRQFNAAGQLAVPEIVIDGTEHDWRTFVGIHGKSQRKLNAAAAHTVNQIVAQHDSHDITVLSDFHSLAEAATGDDDIYTFGQRHVHEVPLFFSAAKQLCNSRPHGYNQSWGLYINSDRNDLPENHVELFGATDGESTPWGYVAAAAACGIVEFSRHYELGEPLKDAWTAGHKVIKAYLQTAHEDFYQPN